ncbi:unnamed protein product [Cutaneotrichosporon oleaginosum]
MGVPALFRWLSKKYPKIVYRVQEDTPTKIRKDDGEIVEVPVRYESENPNGFEVDNLYLDMNGIVHPCTHPEGRPAPETEEEMMVEVFRYTERVVNMARPRKVLMMAIDGVAPRAKMNQQRSRRFRSAQEAQEKEIERQEAIKMYEAMGNPVSEETKNKKAWDSNAITPGTPFMDLLSKSLKYWVAMKLSTDPGWKDLKVIISDASVPGEGEHKIVDWIRRQRSHPTWNANTSHAMYGLDADLIMLGLATHEPIFRILREDVFAQGNNRGPQTCSNCGKIGHIKVNCKQPKKVKDPNEVEKAVPVDPKPFIWLDVNVLREYLAVELNVPNVPFKFDQELAIDDWIFMIFFVGNDFLPHLPSLEIREGAIDKLLEIWRNELPRMGGYLTNHGKVNLDRAQIILEGLASREDSIFQKRKEDEDRQKSREKHRRKQEHDRQDRENGVQSDRGSMQNDRGTMQLNGQDYVAVAPADTARGGRLHPSLPTRPGFDTEVAEPAKPAFKPGKKLTYQQQAESLKAGLAAMSGSNADIVKNRKAIRMANMSAADKLRAELEGDDAPGEASQEEPQDEPMEETAENGDEGPDLDNEEDADEDEDEEEEDDEDVPAGSKRKKSGRTGRQRKAIKLDGEEDDEEEEADDDDEAPPNPGDEHVSKKKLKVNPDGTVDYEDTVRLWEPGYRERYYRQKFGVELSDTKFISEITRSYMEGLCWVLEYYYQGVPAWDWFYPYHYAPFAQDFHNVGELDIKFKAAQPFKPFAQLLGVFPAASRVHLPAPLQKLMIDEDSPILDFYPEDFEIDMNGKKMQWQGVALLPFIDQTRLLTALKSKEEELTDDEKRRNSWGDNVMFIAEENGLFDAFAKAYGVKGDETKKLMPINPQQSLGITGSFLTDPNCVPGASMDSPLPSIEDCPDLVNNRALSVRYYFPRQLHRHRSVILPSYRPGLPKLTESDRDWTRRGGHDKRHGPGHRGGGGNRGHSHGGGPGQARGGRGPQGGAGYGQTPYGGGAPSYGGYGGGSGYGGSGGGYGGAGGNAGGYGGAGGQRGGRAPYGSQPQAAYGGGAGGGYGGYGGGYGGAGATTGGYGGAGGAYGGGGYGGAGGYAAGGGAYGAGNRSYQQPPYGAPPSNFSRNAGGAPRGGYGGSYGSNRGGPRRY